MLSPIFLAKNGQTKLKRKNLVTAITFNQAIVVTKQEIVGVGGDVRARETIVSPDCDFVSELTCGGSLIK